jgi:hypothetical protein
VRDLHLLHVNGIKRQWSTHFRCVDSTDRGFWSSLGRVRWLSRGKPVGWRLVFHAHLKRNLHVDVARFVFA